MTLSDLHDVIALMHSMGITEVREITDRYGQREVMLTEDMFMAVFTGQEHKTKVSGDCRFRRRKVADWTVTSVTYLGQTHVEPEEWETVTA